MIDTGERNEHDAGLGWGPPFHGTLPWLCEQGSVTLAWRAKLQPGANYYWSGIPIPPELVRNGKLYGRASLTAILRPLISPFAGANYFASRLQTSLRYPTGADDWEPLVGKMLESTLREQDAREEPKRGSRCGVIPAISRTVMASRSMAPTYNSTRAFTRICTNSAGTITARWASRMSRLCHHPLSGDGGSSIYNSTVNGLGNFVESAVINQDIELKND